MKAQLNATIRILSLGAAMASVFFSGCRKDGLKYDVPETYDFENVSYSGQSQRMDMVEEMVGYMETALTPGTTLDSQRLIDMFENANNPFTFTSTKQLKDKCFLSEQDSVYSLIGRAVSSSSSSQAAAQGVAGIGTSSNGQSKYLFDANGVDVITLTEVTLMGAVMYYQATGVYLTDAKTGAQVDNETVTDGEGTALQHHWDEAFGYFGAPKDFPTNTANARFWAAECNELESKLHLNDSIMTAFITGRAAINNDDHETKDAQIAIIREKWEIVVAAIAIHELNEAKDDFGDDALRNHEVTEAIGFIRSLQFNPIKKISNAQVQSALGALGTNLYAVTLQDLDEARDLLASVYGLTSIKDQL